MTDVAASSSRLPVGSSARSRPGPVHQRAGDGDALHLAPGKLMRVAVRKGRDAYHLQHLGGAPARSSYPRELKGQLDVLDRAQSRKELQELEDESDAAAAELGQRVVVQGGGPDPFDLDVTARREVGRAGEVEQGRLAAAAPADDGQPLPPAEVQGDPVESGNPLIRNGVVLLYIEEAEHHDGRSMLPDARRPGGAGTALAWTGSERACGACGMDKPAGAPRGLEARAPQGRASSDRATLPAARSRSGYGVSYSAGRGSSATASAPPVAIDRSAASATRIAQ